MIYQIIIVGAGVLLAIITIAICEAIQHGIQAYRDSRDSRDSRNEKN